MLPLLGAILYITNHGDRKVYGDEQLKRVTAVLDGSLNHENTPFYTPGITDLRPSQFDENAWSKRLAYSLKEFLPSDLRGQVRYTAMDGLLFGFKQSVMSGIPIKPTFSPVTFSEVHQI